MQNISLPSTHCSDDLSSSVCNLMRRHPIHLLTLAHGAPRSPSIDPANRIRSQRRPLLIQYYKVSSNDSGLWCWDATTQAASDDAPSQLRGCRVLLPFFFKVCVRQGRVTLSQKSSLEVRAPNTYVPFLSWLTSSANNPLLP